MWSKNCFQAAGIGTLKPVSILKSQRGLGYRYPYLGTDTKWNNKGLSIPLLAGIDTWCDTRGTDTLPSRY
ncbi:hypothetical protein GQ457_03G013980 [Hibiscus cannabinus]